MESRGGSEQHGSVGSQEEGTSSKWRTSFKEYKEDGVERRGNKCAKVEREGKCEKMETTFGSDYMQEGTRSGDNGSRSE